MIIDTHAHVVPKSLIDALRGEKRLFPSVRLDTEGALPRMAFAWDPLESTCRHASLSIL